MSRHGPSVKEVRLTLGPGRDLSKPKKMRTASRPRRPPNFGPTSRLRVIDDDDDVDEKDGDDMIDSSAMDKMYRDPTGPYTSARYSRFLLYILLIWIIALTVAMLVMLRKPAIVIPPPVFAEKKDPSKWHIPFNLVPDNESNGRLMTLSVPQLTFSKLLKYDVCCKKGPLYACRAVSKNVGVEGYISEDGKATMHINHPDMVGARCTLMWIETRDD